MNSQLSDNPLFIFPYASDLDGELKDSILIQVSKFLSQWDTHGTQISARAWFEESRFLLIEVDQKIAQPSGCSKDKLYHFVESLNKLKDLQLGERYKFYLKSGGEIEVLDKKKLNENWENDSFFPDYQLFPIWISDISSYHKLWGKPIHQFAEMLHLRKRIDIFHE